MSREFPDFVDPWKASEGRRRFAGTMPLNRMKRLQPLLSEFEEAESGDDGNRTDSSVVRFSTEFGRDRQGLVTIRIDIQAELPLQCQRSMTTYREKVDRNSTLVVITDFSEQDQVPEAYEPVLVEEGRIAMLELVEDELLLAIPQVPRNPDLESVAWSTETGGPMAKEDHEKGEGREAGGNSPKSSEAAHPGGSADQGETHDSGEPTHRPFAQLAGLMRDSEDDSA